MHTNSTKKDFFNQDSSTTEFSKRDISYEDSVNVDSIDFDSVKLDSANVEEGATTRALLQYFPGYFNQPCSQDVYGNCGRKNVTVPLRGFNKKAILAEIRRKMKLEELRLDAQRSTLKGNSSEL